MRASLAITFWPQDVKRMFIRRQKNVKNVFGIAFIRLIYIMSPGKRF